MPPCATMFAGTFEAVKSTSPLRDRMQEQVQSGIAKVEAGLRKGIDDGSVRPDVNVAAAVNDVTGAVFGIAFLWVVVDTPVPLDVLIAQARDRIINAYGT